MSFLGGSTRSDKSDAKAQPETPDRRPKSDTTFLGDASQVAARIPEAEPPTAFSREPRPVAPVAPTGQAGPTPPEKCSNVLATGAKWKGTLNVDESVRVDGTFSGEIQAKGTVHIADGAQVDAKVRATYVVVWGTFRGEIRCEQRVELLPRSRVSGEVITKLLSVQEGAILDGRVQMTGDGAGESARPSPRASRAAAAADGQTSLGEREEKASVAPQSPNGDA